MDLKCKPQYTGNEMLLITTQLNCFDEAQIHINNLVRARVRAQAPTDEIRQGVTNPDS
jgi:hypothetical protein